MKITIISLIFPPETGAARRVGEIVQFLAEKGHDVTVITGYPNYPKGVIFEGYKNRFIEKSIWKDKVNIYRVGLYITSKRSSFKHRLLQYLSFMLSSFIGSLQGAKPDVIYFLSPPYFLGITAWLAAKIRGAKLAMDVQDFWPEAAIAVGWVKNKTFIKFLYATERFIYRKCDTIFTVSDVMKRKIIERGIPEDKIFPNLNWCDTNTYAPVSGDSIRKLHNLEAMFVILFAGNLGIAQSLDNVLEAAKILQANDDNTIVFVLLGEGVEKSRLVEKGAKLKLNNVKFLPGVPESEVPYYFGMSNVLLSNLGRAPHREAAIPSKIQVYMTSAKPLLVAAEGASVQLVEKAICGITVPPDDPVALSKAALELAGMSKDRREQLGRAAREYAIEHFDLKKQCAFCERKLKEIAGVL